MRHCRRSRLFIDREVQGAILIRMFMHWLLLMFGTLAFLGCLEILINGSDGPPSTQLWNVWERHRWFFIAPFLLLPAFVNDMIKLSHRFVGPVARVHTELRRLAEGKPANPIKLRKNDYWKDLAADFNAALDKINCNERAATLAQIAKDPNRQSEHQDAETELQTCS
jgi:hypothetical protein